MIGHRACDAWKNGAYSVGSQRHFAAGRW